MKQKSVFLESEGNQWFRRNAEALRQRDLPGSDSVLLEILQLRSTLPAEPTILEVGCGDGSRLAWLRENIGAACSGVEPSADAVATARSRGIDAVQGTADLLPFADASMDIAIFGFCLYLCDREDLARIAAEADRVLRSPGWLVLLDFYSPTPLQREYHHRSGLFSYKMDYRTLFTWNPAFTEYSHSVRHHADGSITDDPQQWIATSVLRKRPASLR